MILINYQQPTGESHSAGTSPPSPRSADTVNPFTSLVNVFRGNTAQRPGGGSNGGGGGGGVWQPPAHTPSPTPDSGYVCLSMVIRVSACACACMHVLAYFEEIQLSGKEGAAITGVGGVAWKPPAHAPFPTLD